MEKPIIEVSLGSLSSLLSWRRKSDNPTEEEAGEASKAAWCIRGMLGWHNLELQCLYFFLIIIFFCHLEFQCLFLKKIIVIFDQFWM